MRAQYNREKKRRAKVTGPGRDDMKQWVYYEVLTFLDANEKHLESQYLNHSHAIMNVK